MAAAPSAALVKPAGRVCAGLTAADGGAQWSGDFFFTQLADTQFGLFDTNSENVSWTEESALFKLAIVHINTIKPRFVIVCGDLTNAMPNGRYKAPSGLMASQVLLFVSVLAQLVHCSCMPLLAVATFTFWLPCLPLARIHNLLF